MRPDRTGKGAEVSVHPAPMVEGRPRSGAWRQRRETIDGREWLGLHLTGPDGVSGQAWAPDSEALRHAIERELGAAGAGDLVSGDSERSIERRLARGLIASAALDARCHRHAVSLPLWLGGAVRREVPVALPIVFHAHDRTEREAEWSSQGARLHEAATALGITSFAVHDSSPDPDLIADTVIAMRDAAGPGPALMLRLAGQLSPADASTLVARIRGADLISVADPCASIAMSVEATRDRLPALGLSAWRYAREALLACLAAAPPTVLVADPLLEGGAAAVRQLAAIARVLQIDVSLTAAAGGPWLAHLCADLAAAMPACQQPVELFPDWTLDRLRALGVCSGALRPSTASPRPRAILRPGPRDVDAP